MKSIESQYFLVFLLTVYRINIQHNIMIEQLNSLNSLKHLQTDSSQLKRYRIKEINQLK
jgi:hypothetical protein